MFDRFSSKTTGIILLFLTAAFILYPLVGKHATDKTNFKSPFEAIIFNLEGVLVNNDNLKFLAWQKTFANYGLPLTLTEYEYLLSCNDEQAALEINTKNNTQHPKEKFIQEKNVYYQHLYQFHTPQIRPAVLMALELAGLKESLNIKLALTSNASKAEVLFMLKFIGLENIFDVIVSGDDLKDIQDPDGIEKPKPYIYQRVAEKLKTEPKKCLVFENTEAGVDSAINAQMSVIAVPNQFTKTQNFSKAKERLPHLLYFDIYQQLAE